MSFCFQDVIKKMNKHYTMNLPSLDERKQILDLKIEDFTNIVFGKELDVIASKTEKYVNYLTYFIAMFRNSKYDQFLL